MYKPKTNDYVKFNDVEGWIYYVGSQYLTIELLVKDKDEQNIKDCPIHKKSRCLVLCYREEWDELVYVKSR
jgi:hypothetical protein